MVQCPSCSHEIDQEFGMVTCPECHAVFMIDFSGNVESAENAEAPAEESFEAGEDILEEEPLSHDEFNENFEEPLAVEEEFEAVEEEPIHEEFQPLEEEFVEEPVEELVAEEEVMEEDFMEPEPLEPVAAMPATPDTEPVDITDFANSEESSLEDGLYLYNLSIDRIDSKEFRDIVKYVLGDQKLKLDVVSIMSNLSKGRLVIKDLHPLKAKRIIEQLQYYDFDIRWEQHLVVLEEDSEMDLDADA